MMAATETRASLAPSTPARSQLAVPICMRCPSVPGSGTKL